MRKYFTSLALSFALLVVLLVPSASKAGFFDSKFERNIDNYEKEGKKWGEKLADRGVLPENVNEQIKINSVCSDLIDDLISKEKIYYFGVHPELKEAFKKGFREGYQDRTADLVLGPHLENAAGRIGNFTATGFVNVIRAFENGWRDTLNDAVQVFVTLVAEGSQADRESFINNFIEVYKAKYLENQKSIKSASSIAIVSEGGLNLFFTSRAKCTLDIPSDGELKKEIYQQTFREMGYEMGDRYSHNLISRPDLVDWMRRSKTALNMDLKSIDNKLILANLGIIKKTFVDNYGIDGDSVFEGLSREAGYK